MEYEELKNQTSARETPPDTGEFSPERLRGAGFLIRELLAEKNKDAKETLEALDERVSNCLDVVERGLSEEDYWHRSLTLLNELAKNPTSERTKSFGGAMEILERNLALLQKRVEHVSPAAKKDMFHSALFLVWYGTEAARNEGVLFLEKNLFAVEDAMTKAWSGEKYLPFLETVIAYGADEKKEQALGVIRNQIRMVPAHIMASCLISIRPEVRNVAEEEFKKMAEPYSIPWETLLRAWKASTSSTDFGNVLLRNFISIDQLEKHQKGLTKFLYETFGVLNFSRYPIELLVNQAAEYENTRLPYGVIFNPRDDYNGAFYDNRRIYNDLINQLENRFLVRAAEGESKIDIVKMLNRLNNKYGGEHKISFAIVGGHGTKDSIQFGGDDKKHVLRTEDLKERISGRKKNRAERGGYFEEGATLILNSCSTGYEEGIGQELSRILGIKTVTVIAPDRDAPLKTITVTIKDGRPQFGVTYLEGESTRFASGKKITNQSPLPPSS